MQLCSILGDRLKQKVAIITGSSSGIGSAAAKVFAKEGASVVVGYNRTQSGASEVIREIESSGGRAIMIQANIGKENEVRSLFEKTLNEFGRVDILVNNAGTHTIPLDYHEIDDKMWEENLNINLMGAWYCIRHCADIMQKQQSGSIINVSSITNLMGLGANLPYACAKAGQVVLTKYFARILAPFVKVNCIGCGVVETRLSQQMSDARRKFLTELTLFKRFGEPEEIANVMLFLASDESSYITGQTLIVDGGEFTISP